MRRRSSVATDRLLQALADASTWLLFKGTRVRC
jgi:hypothetical protein